MHVYGKELHFYKKIIFFKYVFEYSYINIFLTLTMCVKKLLVWAPSAFSCIQSFADIILSCVSKFQLGFWFLIFLSIYVSIHFMAYIL